MNTAIGPAAPDSLIHKIQKLLQLSRDEAATEHEAALAAAKVHQLLATYNLSLTEVEAQGIQSEQDMRVEGWKTSPPAPVGTAAVARDL